jgi:hypothetical protein
MVPASAHGLAPQIVPLAAFRERAADVPSGPSGLEW